MLPTIKRLGSVIFSAVLFIAAPAAEDLSDGRIAYEQAVAAYLEAAAHEMSAYRREVETMASKSPEKTDDQIGKTREQLAACDKLLVDLKKAARSDFDKIKAEYERNRAALLKTIEAVRKGRG